MAIYNHPNFGAYIEGLCQIVTACTAITMLTPTKSDDKVFNIILKGLNLLSGNFKGIEYGLSDFEEKGDDLIKGKQDEY